MVQRLAAEALGIALGVLVDPVPAEPPDGAVEPDSRGLQAPRLAMTRTTAGTMAMRRMVAPSE
jgi:hypothetical protein